MSKAPPRDADCSDGPLAPKENEAGCVAVARVYDPRRRSSQSRATEATLQGLDSRLNRWAGRMREAAQRGAFRLWPQLAAAALAIEARGLGLATIPHLFARDLIRIPPTLNDDLLELYGRSEQVLANRFGFFGANEEFGPEINWQPSRGRAWQVEMHSFDYALDLALTYKISGDERYARHLRYLLADWIASNPPGKTIGWTPIALARRIRNWILASDLCRESFASDADFFKVFASSLAQQVTYVAWQARTLEDRRGRLLASRALLVASRVFAGAQSESLGEIARSLLADALADGTASFPDHPQPLRQFELASACAEHVLFGAGSVLSAPVADVRLSQTLTRSAVADHPLPQGEGLAPGLISSPPPRGEGGERIEPGEGVRGELESTLETLEGMLHPDGTLPLFGREPMPPVDAVTTLFSLGASLLTVPRWKSLAGNEFGILPYMILGEAGKLRFDDMPSESWHADSRLQSGSGIYRLSDGESSAMLISAVPHASAHDHRDFLSYELTVRGQRTVIDSGIGMPAEAGGEDPLAAAIHHNVLLIDGRSPEIESRQGIRDVPVEGHAGIEGLWLSRVVSDGTPPRWAEKSCVPPLMHQRGFFLLDRQFWVVLDHLTGSGANLVESLIHFYPTFSIEVQEGRALAKSGAVSVTIRPVAADEYGTIYNAKVRTNREGWYAPTPGTRYPSPILIAEWKQVRLPAVFGYVVDLSGVGESGGCTIEVSRTEARITLDGVRFSIRIPSG